MLNPHTLIHGPYLSMHDAAKALGVTYTEARRLGRAGVILAVRTPQGWFVRLDPTDGADGDDAPTHINGASVC